jgi:hypothetical protein
MVIRGLLYPNKWDPVKDVDRKDAFLAGDNVTELRTSKNMLSVWLANSQEDIDDAMVAMALNKDNPCKMVAYLMDEKELEGIEIETVDNEIGKALGADESILLKHRNLVELDYWRLGYLTEYMIKLSRNKDRQVVMTKGEVVELLNKYKGTKISADKVNEKLRSKLNW